MEILRVEDLTFRYPNAQSPALENVTFSVNEGDLILVCGESGCGKTTLLRLLKKELAPVGESTGEVLFDGKPTSSSVPSPADIGFVLQDPDDQVVTDKVWHELAFGLENLGVESGVIRRRVGEMASYFGIHEWFRRPTDQLSDGQKQLLNLAAVMAMDPRVLILDEPTSRLDPIAASEFISTLCKLNRELGLTVVIAEHRLEELFPAADKVIVLDAGRVAASGDPRNVGDKLKNHPMAEALPCALRVFDALDGTGDPPLTVRDGRAWIERSFSGSVKCAPRETDVKTAPVVEFDDVWFRYARDIPDVLRGTSFSVNEGEFFCLLGGNGTGKTTALDVAAGLERPYRGHVSVFGKKIADYKGQSLYRRCLAYLPQDPLAVFVRDTVRRDLEDICAACGVERSDVERRIGKTADLLDIGRLLDRHPCDLSGGERQRCAIAKVLLSEPRVLLLDEPTKGMDAKAKKALGALLSSLKSGGVTVFCVTHDTEFAAEFADRCALFFDGEVIAADASERFFADNKFYTTAACRMARGIWRYATTAEKLIALCREERSMVQ